MPSAREELLAALWAGDIGEDKDWAEQLADAFEREIREQVAKERDAAILGIVWQWIEDANNGLGSDVGDLMFMLEKAGYGPPEESSG